MSKPLNDPTNQSDAEASFWAKAEREAEKPMSATPRTDAQEGMVTVPRDFACELELELKRAYSAIEDMQPELGKLKSELAAKEQELRELALASRAFTLNPQNVGASQILMANQSEALHALRNRELTERLEAKEQELAEARARDEFNWKILRECADILCLPDESPSLLPDKIRTFQMCYKSEKQAKVERGDMMIEAQKECDALRQQLTARDVTIERLRKALSELIDCCDGNYRELVDECRAVLKAAQLPPLPSAVPKFSIPKEWIARKAQEELESGASVEAGSMATLKDIPLPPAEQLHKMLCACGAPMGTDGRAQVYGRDGTTYLAGVKCAKCDRADGLPSAVPVHPDTARLDAAMETKK